MNATIQDTTFEPCTTDPNFTATRDCLIYRYNGQTYFRRLYRVNFDVSGIEVPAGFAVRGCGSRNGIICLVFVRYTNRKHDWQAKNQKVAGSYATGKSVRYQFANSEETAPQYGIIAKNHFSY